MTLQERFWSKVAIDENRDLCWPFLGFTQKGYGRFSMGRKNGPVLAHRLAYEMANGPVPVGLELDHLCRNRSCCNPSHLEPVTRQVNTIRGEGPRLAGLRQASKTHCPSGHEYNAANTYVATRGQGKERMCRICARDRMREKRSINGN